MPKGSGNLLIADKLYAIDWPTVNMHDEGGFNAHILGCATGFAGAQACKPDGTPRAAAKGLEGKIQRYRPRHIAGNERSLRAAQAVIKQFVIHLDGCQNAGMCFDVLHNERALSCHFVVDNDGTIYQTLDLSDCAYHASGMNETSIGVEISNRGNAVQLPNQYNYAGAIPREEVVCFVNKEKYVAYDFTPQQYAAMEVLAKALAKLLPGIKLDYPHLGGTNDQSWDTLEPNDPSNVHLRETYSGYIGHYHTTTQKWDPGPFDFKKFIGKLSGSRSFPIGLPQNGGKTPIPGKPEDKVFDAYYTNNEYDAEKAGGYFPIGPLEMSQLWHGGIHIHGERGDPVVAPFPGQVVVARNGKENQNVGSTNFVLMKHTPNVGGEKLTFFTLL